MAKLDGVSPNANNYVHPASHPPSVITQDANNRFFTDAERTKLTGVQAGAQVNAVTTVAGRTGAIVVAKGDVGLANVDNVKQASKTEFDAHLTETVSETIVVARDVTVTGAQVVSGFSKKPKRVDVLASVLNTKKMSIGARSINRQNCFYSAQNGYVGDWNVSISIAEDTGSAISLGSIAFNSDNTITINWTKVGVGATGTANIAITAHYHGKDGA